jgi:hypothetical protein
MNWDYRGGELVKMERITVRIRGTGPVHQVRSTWQRQAVPFKQEGDDVEMSLPEVEDGDILLLD